MKVRYFKTPIDHNPFETQPGIWIDIFGKVFIIGAMGKKPFELMSCYCEVSGLRAKLIKPKEPREGDDYWVCLTDCGRYPRSLRQLSQGESNQSDLTSVRRHERIEQFKQNIPLFLGGTDNHVIASCVPEEDIKNFFQNSAI